MLRMLEVVRQDLKSSLGVIKSILLLYERKAVREGQDMPFRGVDQRYNKRGDFCSWQGRDFPAKLSE